MAQAGWMIYIYLQLFNYPHSVAVRTIEALETYLKSIILLSMYLGRKIDLIEIIISLKSHPSMMTSNN